LAVKSGEKLGLVENRGNLKEGQAEIDRLEERKAGLLISGGERGAGGCAAD